MTGTDTPSTPPGGGGSPRRMTALEQFDLHGRAVFAAACRVTPGQRALSVEITRTTFSRLRSVLDLGRSGVPIDRRALVVAAHRTYLSDPRAGDEGKSEPSELSADASWGARRAEVLTALQGLTARERVALDLRHVIGLTRDEAADVLGCMAEEVDRLADPAAIVPIAGGSSREAPEDAMRRAELWFGDDDRESIRRTLGAADSDLPGDTDDEPVPAERRRMRPVLIGALAVIALTAGGVRWVQSLPERGGDAAPVDTLSTRDDSPPRTSSPTNQPDAAPARGATNDIDVTPVEDAVGPPDLFVMASGLDDPQVLCPTTSSATAMASSACRGTARATGRRSRWR